MIKTIFHNEEIIFRLDTYLKQCVKCGQLAVYRIRYIKRKYGWRLCGKHLSQEMRNMLRDNFYGF